MCRRPWWFVSSSNTGLSRTSKTHKRGFHILVLKIILASKVSPCVTFARSGGAKRFFLFSNGRSNRDFVADQPLPIRELRSFGGRKGSIPRRSPLPLPSATHRPPLRGDRVSRCLITEV